MGNVKPYAILLKVLFGELLVICQSFLLLKIFTANVFIIRYMQLDTLSFNYTLDNIDIEDLHPNIPSIITFHYTSRIFRRLTCYA